MRAAGIALLVLSGVAGLGAREKVTFTPKDAKAALTSKPPTCEIRVLPEAKLDVAYVEVGTINFHDERHRAASGPLKLEAALPALKAAACKAGADALIDIRVTEDRHLEFAMFNVRAVAVRGNAGP